MRVEEIEVHAGEVDFQYEPLRRVEARCEARSNFSKAPTLEDVNNKLRELALKAGGNAVIGVTYESGMSLTSWRSMKGNGLAVVKQSDFVRCPACAETIRREALKCRFCGEMVAQPISEQRSSVEPLVPPSRAAAMAEEPLKATDNHGALILGIIAAVLVAVFVFYQLTVQAEVSDALQAATSR